MSFFKNLFGITEESNETGQRSSIEKIDDDKLKSNVPDKGTSSTKPLSIQTEQIYLQKSFNNRTEVLKFIAENMSALGFVSGDYFEALTNREKLVSTYLTNGVAIPHGVNEAKSLIKNTGVIIVQIPTGVIWNESGDIVHLVIGIAAKENEHLALLQKLSSVVTNPELSKRLANTTEPDLLLEILNTDTTSPPVLPKGFTITAEATVIEKYGLHAEPAAILAKHAALYENTQIHLHSGKRCANIKSMSVILMMGIKEGDKIILAAKGEHAQIAVTHLAEIINTGLTNQP